MEISRMYPDGIHLVGYSQGGLIGRAILECFPDHNVKHFISLSSPQAGQYGSECHTIQMNAQKKFIMNIFLS